MPASVFEPLLSENEHNAEKCKCLPQDVLDLTVCSWWSRVTFSWVSPVLYFGSRNIISQKDCPRFGFWDKSSHHAQKFEENWKRMNFADAKTSLPACILETFWFRVIATGILAFMYLLCLYSGPVLVGELVSHAGRVRDESWMMGGIMLVLLLVCSKVAQSLLERTWQFEAERMSVWMNSALTSAIFKKGLQLSSTGRANHGPGECVNYLSVDVERITSFCWWMHDIWLLPVQILMALVLLYRTLGLGSLSGITVLFVFLCLQIPLARQTEKVQSKIMSAKDQRVRFTSESLRSIRLLKLLSWDEHFLTALKTYRDTEYRWLCIRALWNTLNGFLLYLSPLFVAVCTLATCVLLGEDLTASKVFTALTIFEILRDPIYFLPMLVTHLVEGAVSSKRLERLLHGHEHSPETVSSEANLTTAVSIKEGSFLWGSEELGTPSLRGLNLGVKKGSLVAVCGGVGSGKSSLLACMLGEMERKAGTINVDGTVAYVSQTAWIPSGTIQEIVLFGSIMDEERYSLALRVCALEEDLKRLPGGDQCEIGERGVNLSGGQKQRLQLARAVYQDRDIYLLDDPFSAVDAQTGRHLLQECVLTFLAPKTVILVTHQIDFLPAADLVLVMKDGEIAEMGTFKQLQESGTVFSALLSAHEKGMSGLQTKDNLRDDFGQSKIWQSGAPAAGKSNEEDWQGGELVEEEEAEKGEVDIRLYFDYLTKIWNGGLIPLVVLTLAGYQASQAAGNYWLSYATAPENKVLPLQLLQTYAFLTSTGIGFMVVRVLCINLGGILIAQKYFSAMISRVFHAPMSFFDSTPSSRIMSRSSHDQGTIDLDLPSSFSGSARNMADLLSILFITAFVSPFVLLVSVPAALGVYFLQRYYMKSCREFRRLQAKAQSPILQHISESLEGFMTVRSFQRSGSYFQRTLELLDAMNSPSLLQAGASEWFMLRLDLLSTLTISTLTTLLLSLPESSMAPGLVGLALMYGLTLNNTLVYWAWWASQLETQIISVERLKQYSVLEQEASQIIEGCSPPSEWPMKGSIDFKAVEVRYRPESPPVLSCLTFSVPGGSKVGIVGRTGSGKSTLVHTLFRITEPCHGCILVDGLDIALMGLRDLRSRLGIIPQEPALFQGTIRYNMDPLGQYNDNQIWEALDRCQLGKVIRQKVEGLSSQVGEGGNQWSVGERQLFCLTRVVLKSARIVVLDEATASVDSATDQVIQRTVETCFSDSTVLTVAHRIPTVIGCDRVMVLDKGCLVEYSSPSELLEDETSRFAAMVSHHSQTFVADN